MADQAVSGPRAYIRFGDHVDTIESVDTIFKEQRRLSFTYGAIFFGVTLAIPALTVWATFWWQNEIWGGFTWNYLFVSLIYFFFLWTMAWTYARRADNLDKKLEKLAEDMTHDLVDMLDETKDYEE
jgi:uncharacterized membrane protein (DUF485 family)